MKKKWWQVWKKKPKCEHEWEKWEDWTTLLQKRRCKLCGLAESRFI